MSSQQRLCRQCVYHFCTHNRCSLLVQVMLPSCAVSEMATMPYLLAAPQLVEAGKILSAGLAVGMFLQLGRCLLLWATASSCLTEEQAPLVVLCQG